MGAGKNIIKAMDNRLEYNREIIKLLSEYVEKYPTQRFGQLLFNLNINQFSDKDNPENQKFRLRDIYNDESEVILQRIKERSARFKD
ncbi:hypothetical protein AAFN85_14775 [Mucilaginibacter sp. CAU 1740]|uniref:hypothetical protein n=1 Tax=Mucilaginibacter sp. CAU 1740 TaxID=3140365 RepID=UPI00325BF588